MSEGSPASRVGIRELRQNLSVYVDRVKEGETLEVTEHGRPVARLAPIRPKESSPYERMLAEGRAVAAVNDLLDVRPVDLGPGSNLTDVLVAMREEDPR